MQEIPDKFPDVVRIEPVGKCNFRCIHCPTGTRPNNRAELTSDKLNLIISQCTANNFTPRVVVLYHGGEPLLNKNIAHYVQAFKKIGVTKTVITTNASLLNEKLAEELIMAGLDEIKISFDGESADENNAIRKNSNFYRDAANVKALLKLRKKLGRNNPNVIISNARIYDKNKLGTFKLKNGKQCFTFQDIPVYLTRHFSDELGEIEFRSYPAIVWPGYNQFENFEELIFPIQKPKYCSPLFETFTILSNGDVVPCCSDIKGELILGNVFETSMFDIWKSKKYTEMRANFKKQIYPLLCSKCSLLSPRYLCKKT